MNSNERKFYNGKEYFKIGTVELFRDECEEIYNSKKYILTSTSVYQLFFSQASNIFYGQKVYYQKGARFTRQGRYHVFDGAYINDLIGFQLLN